MPLRALKDFLDSKKVKYVRITHSPAFTAQEIAASAHIAGKEVAKTVVVKMDGKMALAVLPATHKLDMEMMKKATGAEDVRLASEKEFASLFPGCEVGAMPPFGNLFDMDVYVASSLAEDEEIAFNAGTHTELLRLRYRDFEKLVHPKVTALTH